MLGTQTEKEYQGLKFFLRQRTGFHLALALYNDAHDRSTRIRELKESLSADKIELRIIDLLQASTSRTLLESFQAAIQNFKPDDRLAVVVVNLESKVDYNPELKESGSSSQDFLATANLHRELLETTCPFPIVLWMTELLERAIVKQAPDLWQWRSHVFDLRTRPQPQETIMFKDGRRLSSHDQRLHPEIRLQRLEEELAAYRKIGSRKDEMRVLNAIGIARFDAGDAKLARNVFEAVLKIARELGDRSKENDALSNLGNVYFVLGDLHQSISFHEQVLEAYRKIGDLAGEAGSLGNLGNAYSELAETSKAGEFFEQCLARYREIGDRHGEGITLGNLGNVYADLGDAHKAREYYHQQLQIALEMSDLSSAGTTLGNLGIIYSELGDVQKALELYFQQLILARKIGDRASEGRALWNAALSNDELGEHAEAIFQAEAALSIFEATGNPKTEMVRTTLAKWRS